MEEKEAETDEDTDADNNCDNSKIELANSQNGEDDIDLIPDFVKKVTDKVVEVETTPEEPQETELFRKFKI